MANRERSRLTDEQALALGRAVERMANMAESAAESDPPLRSTTSHPGLGDLHSKLAAAMESSRAAQRTRAEHLIRRHAEVLRAGGYRGEEDEEDEDVTITEPTGAASGADARSETFLSTLDRACVKRPRA